MMGIEISDDLDHHMGSNLKGAGPREKCSFPDFPDDLSAAIS